MSGDSGEPDLRAMAASVPPETDLRKVPRPPAVNSASSDGTLVATSHNGCRRRVADHVTNCRRTRRTHMARYSLNEFVTRTAQQDRGQGHFELENERLLEINLNGMTWTKTGSMVAYLGQIKFTREGVLEHGVGKFLKKALTGEGTRLTKAEGAGKLYLADAGKKISVLHLAGDALFVNGNDVLAFEPSLKWDIKMMRKVTAMVAGGLFNVRFEGT